MRALARSLRNDQCMGSENADYLAQSPEAREMISEIRKAVVNNDGRISDPRKRLRASSPKHEAEFQDPCSAAFSSARRKKWRTPSSAT